MLLLGFLLSHDISSRYWIWDREWHTPFTSALRAQRMPFRNVYEPALTLRYHMTFSLTGADGAEWIMPTELELERDLSYDENLALAKEQEAEVLYKAMQSDLVQQVMRRLSSAQPPAAS